MRRISVVAVGTLLAVGLVVTGVAGAASARAVKSTLPTVTSVSPNQGSPNGGTLVTIKGKNILGATSVQIGTASVAVVPKNKNSIEATAPAESEGTVDVRVTTNEGQSAITPADTFTYVVRPVIQSLAPRSGSTLGGNQVVISGSDFAGATAVDFGTTPATSFTVAESGQAITAVSPAEPAGKVEVTVTGPDGTSPLDPSADTFTFAVRVPKVSSVSPDCGAAGQSVTITGSGYNKKTVTAVDFGPTPATFTIVSGTSIQATVPSGSGEVEVTVSGSKGTSGLNPPSDSYNYSCPTS